ADGAVHGPMSAMANSGLSSAHRRANKNPRAFWPNGSIGASPALLNESLHVIGLHVRPLSQRPPRHFLRFHNNTIVCDRIVAIKCAFDARSGPMSLEWPGGGSRSLAWSNPVARWWFFLALVSATNIAAFFLLYHYLQKPQTGGFATTGIELMLLL